MLTTQNLTLRPIKAEDIPNYQTWTTTETEWQDWDAPWEKDDDDSAFIARQIANIGIAKKIYYKLEIETATGAHIGWVSAYDIDGDSNKLAVGIDIPPPTARGKGYGQEALTAFINYLFTATGKTTIYTQTWSGNLPMLALAAKMGFKETARIKDKREVNGQKYDALTFAITPQGINAK